MFTPSLPNHAGCQIDHSRNHVFFPSNSRFHALKYVEPRHHAFPLLEQIIVNLISNELIVMVNTTRYCVWTSLDQIIPENNPIYPLLVAAWILKTFKWLLIILIMQLRSIRFVQKSVKVITTMGNIIKNQWLLSSFGHEMITVITWWLVAVWI